MILPVGAKETLKNAFDKARAQRVGAIQVLPSPFLNAQRKELIALAAQYRLPAFYEFKEFVEDGGLMSYGPNIVAMYRDQAGYVDRILKGSKPGEMPIERPSTFELAINVKTAAALGLKIPQSLLRRADVILK